jgi:hypothetical protein
MLAQYKKKKPLTSFGYLKSIFSQVIDKRWSWVGFNALAKRMGSQPKNALHDA